MAEQKVYWVKGLQVVLKRCTWKNCPYHHNHNKYKVYIAGFLFMEVNAKKHILSTLNDIKKAINKRVTFARTWVIIR